MCHRTLTSVCSDRRTTPPGGSMQRIRNRGSPQKNSISAAQRHGENKKRGTKKHEP